MEGGARLSSRAATAVLRGRSKGDGVFGKRSEVQDEFSVFAYLVGRLGVPLAALPSRRASLAHASLARHAHTAPTDTIRY